MNIADLISRHAEQRPYSVALIEGQRIVHYATLDRAIWQAAAWLRAQGIRPGDMLGITLPNTTLHVVALYAVARLGAVMLPLSPTDPVEVRATCARRLGAVAVVGHGSDAHLPDLPLLAPDPGWLEASAAPPDRSVRHPGGDAPLRVMLSSGTTGASKASCHSHHAWLASEAIDQPYFRNTADDRYLMSIGPAFAIGLSQCMRIIGTGGCVVIPPGAPSAEELLAIIDRFGITRLMYTPSHLHALLPYLPSDGPRCPGVRQLLALTAIVPEALRAEIRRRFTPNLMIRYSTNEFFTLTLADAETQIRYPETVGRPVAGIEVQVVDDAGRPLRAGEVGLIRARGRSYPMSFIDDPQATAATFRDGWYYPGDLGVFDRDGVLFLKGRADDLMNFEGVKIFPVDIEDVLQRHPAVAEAAAFPLASAHRQDLPAAVVVLRDLTATPEALLAHCRTQLGPRAPVYIAIVPRLPRSAIGKVLKRELAKSLQSQLAARGITL